MSRSFPILALAFLLVLPGVAMARSGGIVELEAPTLHGGGGGVNGCVCHSSLFRAANSPTQVFVSGLPEAYAPGETYALQILVLGVPNDSGAGGVPTGSAVAGFSLFVTKGELAPVDGTVRVSKMTECGLMQQMHEERLVEGSPGVCQGDSCAVTVRVDDKCSLYDPSVPFCSTCDLDLDASCRPCDDQTALAWEATHTGGSTTVPLDPTIDDLTGTYTDGNNRFFWDVEWTAPPTDSGRVRINVAGNVANGNGRVDSGDQWNFGDRVYICEDGVDCSLEDSGGHH